MLVALVELVTALLPASSLVGNLVRQLIQRLVVEAELAELPEVISQAWALNLCYSEMLQQHRHQATETEKS